MKKKQIIIISKIDLINKKELEKILKIIKKYTNMPTYGCSSVKKTGLDIIINYLLNLEMKNIKTKKDEKWLPENQ